MSHNNKELARKRRLANLELGKIPKGKSGNPAGKPVGIVNTKTILREILESDMSGHETVKKLMAEYPMTFDKSKKWTAQRVLQLAEFKGALKGALDGDPRMATLIHRLNGDLVDKQEITGAEGGAIQIESKEVSEDLKKIINEFKK